LEQRVARFAILPRLIRKISTVPCEAAAAHGRSTNFPRVCSSFGLMAAALTSTKT
jgi:hypothetical protein